MLTILLENVSELILDTYENDSYEDAAFSESKTYGNNQCSVNTEQMNIMNQIILINQN